jgi:hypothetical protein
LCVHPSKSLSLQIFTGALVKLWTTGPKGQLWVQSAIAQSVSDSLSLSMSVAFINGEMSPSYNCLSASLSKINSCAMSCD